jgi:phosphinothricin acetyltransferase
MGTDAGGLSRDQGLILRDAAGSDAAALAGLYGWHVLNGLGTFEEEPPGAEEMERRWSLVTARGYPWLIAELAGRPVGYAYAGPFRDRSGYRFTAENSVYVAPEACGRGVGRALLEAVLERCAARGVRRMLAAIGDSENHASIALHRACGFELCGRLSAVGFKHNRWLDVVWMERTLDSSADRAPTPP